MGSQDRRNIAFPTGNVEGSDYYFRSNFGGSGAAGDDNPSAYRYVYWPIEVNKFSSYNKKLILRNVNFIVRASQAAIVSEAYSVLTSYHAPDSSFDTSKALAKIDVPAGTNLPIEIEIDQTISDKDVLPQPISGEYEGIIYVVIDLLTTGRYIGTTSKIVEAMKTVALQYEATP